MKDHDDKRHPGISMHKIPVGAGIAGLVFTVGSMAVFLIGIPALRYFLGLGLVLWLGIAIVLHLTDRSR